MNEIRITINPQQFETLTTSVLEGLIDTETMTGLQVDLIRASFTVGWSHARRVDTTTMDHEMVVHLTDEQVAAVLDAFQLTHDLVEIGDNEDHEWWVSEVESIADEWWSAVADIELDDAGWNEYTGEMA